MSTRLDEFRKLLEPEADASVEQGQAGAEALFADAPADTDIDAAAAAFLACANGRVLTGVLEGLSKISALGQADEGVGRFTRRLIEGGVVHQRVYLLFTISQMKLGRISEGDTQDVVFSGLEKLNPKTAVLPILEYFSGEKAFLRRCVEYLLDEEDTEVASILLNQHRKLGADLNDRLLRQGFAPRSEQELKDASVTILKAVAERAERREEFSKAMSALIMLALQDNREVEPVARFFRFVEHTGSRYFADFWTQLFSERAQTMLRHAAAAVGLELVDPDTRINLIIPITNIGDLSAYVSYLPAMARHYGAKINAMLPDSRTNREMAQLFETEDVQIYLTGRDWMLAHWRPWLETLPFTPGSVGAVWMAARPSSMYRQGSWDHRFDHVRNLLGLPHEARWMQTGRWRQIGRLQDKLEPAQLANAVIIAPHSNSLRDRIGKHSPYCVADLDRMWQVLIAELLDLGKTVIVNGRNQEDLLRSPNEKVVMADLTLSEMLQAIEATGHFIAERSGLLDLVAASDVKGDVSVLYPKGFIYGGPISDRAFETVAFDLDPDQVTDDVAGWVRRRFGPEPGQGAAARRGRRAPLEAAESP